MTMYDHKYDVMMSMIEHLIAHDDNNNQTKV
jgi:hypothetical protein